MTAERSAGAALLRDRVAVVAGVEGGFGASIARALAREGAEVVLGGASDAAVAPLAAEIRHAGGRAREAVADVASAEGCRRLVREALDAHGRIDALVCCAPQGANGGEEIIEVDRETWRDDLESQVFSPLRLVREAAPSMRAAGAGAIVMIGAIDMRLTEARMGTRPVVTGAALFATRMLARELGADGIRVNTVVPGWTDGPALHAALERRIASGQGADAAEARATLLAEHALGRFTESDEIADAVVFLASDLACIVTGQSLDVNCGHHFH